MPGVTAPHLLNFVVKQLGKYILLDIDHFDLCLATLVTERSPLREGWRNCQETFLLELAEICLSVTESQFQVWQTRAGQFLWVNLKPAPTWSGWDRYQMEADFDFLPSSNI